MNLLIPLSSRRRCIVNVLRPLSMCVLTAMAMAVVGSATAEAGQMRSAFKNASPISRAGVTIRNGDRIKLEVTLHDGSRGIPNKLIKFYVTINKKQVFVGQAVTNRHGRAAVNCRIVIPRLVGRKWIPVSWVPSFAGDRQYKAAQNNLLGTGFRVVP